MSAVVSEPDRAPESPLPQKGLRGWWESLAREPNAIWMREMRQTARLGRTPWILFALTLTISLLMCSIGGIAASSETSPAALGGALFQVFFSIAYFVVTVLGPSVAANSIASEREGRTWEAVLLTGLTPKQITTGKFFAAYTTIGLYIVVLAPVGALSFLFGGVTATEVVVAFGFLFALAGLSVAFGLAVSSLMSSLRGAIVVTLMLAICVGPTLYVIFGFTCSMGVHELWPDVPQGLPIWLPLAYTRAPFGAQYVALLLAIPLLLIVVPAWFLYEATVANLTGDAEDRSTGLKRWYALVTPMLAMACAVPSLLATDDDARMVLCLVGIGAFALHAGFCAMLFAAEPAGPSRRVRVHWDRSRVGAFRRFFGPGLSRASVLVASLGVLGMCAIALIDALVIQTSPSGTKYGATPPANYVEDIVLFTIYLACFFLFVVGLTAWLRSRMHAPWVARLITMAIVFLVQSAPWVVAAIGGVLSARHDDDWLIVAAPSPFYVFAMIKAVGKSDPSGVIPVGLACAAVWGVAGLSLLAAASRRCALSVAQEDAAFAQVDAALRAEDDAVARAVLHEQGGDAPVAPVHETPGPA